MRLLSRVDVPEPLSEEELKDLAQRCPAFSVRGGEEFHGREKHDCGLFLILEGRVRGYLTTPAGKKATLDLLGGGTVLWVRRFEALRADAVDARARGRDVRRGLPRHPGRMYRTLHLRQKTTSPPSPGSAALLGFR